MDKCLKPNMPMTIKTISSPVNQLRLLNLHTRPGSNFGGPGDKLLFQILSSASDHNIAFSDLCLLLRRLGFEERTRGSHHIFYKQGIEE